MFCSICYSQEQPPIRPYHVTHVTYQPKFLCRCGNLQLSTSFAEVSKKKQLLAQPYKGIRNLADFEAIISFGVNMWSLTKLLRLLMICIIA